MMEEAVEKAYRSYEAASVRLNNKGKGLTMAEGGQGAESAYSSAYQALVRLGVEPQLRGKYRR